MPRRPEIGLKCVKVAIFPKITDEGLIFSSGPIVFSSVLSLNTCVHAPYSRPPTVGPHGPPNRPRRPEKGLKMHKISYFLQK